MFSNCLQDYVATKLPELHRAGAIGNLKQTSKLLANGANIHELDRYTGASALHYAAQSGNVEVVKLLLEHGAYLNLQVATHGMTPLMVAVWHRKTTLVEYLLNLPGINLEIVATVGVKAEDIIGFGLKVKHSEFDQTEDAQMHQLFLDARLKQQQQKTVNPIFSILLESATTEAQKVSQLQILFTNTAASKLINEILPINNGGSYPHTPILLAARDGQASVVEVLLAHGADQTIVDYYMRSLPIHKAAFSGHSKVIEVLIKDSKIAQVLNVQGPFNGYTPLHDAIWHGHYAAAKILINAGARTDLIGYDGNTAEDLADLYGYSDIKQLFNNSSKFSKCVIIG